MTVKDLPKRGELVKLDTVRRERNRTKVCECPNASFILDDENSWVECAECGAFVTERFALNKIASVDRGLEAKVEALYAQAEEIQNYKPRLRIIKYLEERWNKKELVPVCPSCSEPFLLDELVTWVSRKFSESRISERMKSKG